jgi:hypothetical protein
MIAPQADPVYSVPQQTGFGSLLSVLTLGLIKDAPKAVTLSHDDIMGQMALVVANKLTAKGMVADPAKAKESAGFYLNEYNAWQTVLTDGNAVDAITNEVVNALIASNLVQVLPGYTGAGTVVPASGIVASPTTTINPLLLLGGGALVLLLLRRKRR